MRPTVVATLPVGYADGFLRCLSNRYALMTAEGPAPVRGKICMDMCMVDVTDVPDVREGDTATIFGTDGSESISVDELAEKAGTISYEMLCAVSPRVPRVYLG